MNDLGINKYLEDHYGKTPEGLPYFKLSWTTGLLEHRYSEFSDFYGDILIRTVREVREVPKYPFAEDRWVLERICPITREARDLGLVTDKNYSYREIYIFQDKNGKELPLKLDMVEAALYLFFKFFLQKSWTERTDLRMEILAKKELERKQKTREAIGEGRSPLFFVLGGRK